MKNMSRNERGTFTVWALALCLMLFLLAGISVDVWRAFDARRTLNEIADSAARAGASEIDVRQRQLYSRVVLDPNLAESSSQDSIADNATNDSVTLTGTDVDVDTATNEVHIEIHSTFSFFLLGFLPGAGDSDIVARATARPFQGD